MVIISLKAVVFNICIDICGLSSIGKCKSNIQNHFHKTFLLSELKCMYICAHNVLVYMFANIKGLCNALPSHHEAVAVCMEQ